MSSNSAKKRLAQVVNPERANLIKWFSIAFPGSSVQAIAHLTKIAIENHYVDKRKTPPGEILKHWVTNNNAPQWACRASFDYLIEQHWLPHDEIECAIAARYLLLNGHAISKEWANLTGKWLNLAYQAQEEEEK